MTKTTEKNKVLIELVSISIVTKTKATAELLINCLTKTEIIKKSITVTSGDDLYSESNFLETYKTGFFIEYVNKQETSITFSNGLCLLVGEKYER